MTKNGIADKDGGTLPKEEATTDPKTSQILGDIAQTRSEMSGTLGELQSRLSPDALKEKASETFDDAKDALREATVGKVEAMASNAQDSVVEGGRSVLQFAKDNPIPLALTGLGITWLLMGARSNAPTRTRMRRPASESVDPYDDEDLYFATGENRRADAPGRSIQRMKRGVADVAQSMKGKAEDVAGSASQLAREAQGSVSSATRSATGRAKGMATELRARTSRSNVRVQQTYRDYPLVFGAAVAVAGTAMGLAVPPTRTEQKLIGGAHDALMGEAQGLASGALDKVQDVVQQMGRDGE